MIFNKIIFQNYISIYILQLVSLLVKNIVKCLTFGLKTFVCRECHKSDNNIRVICHVQDGFSCNSVCSCFCFLTSIYRERFHHIRVLEASHQTEANLLSSYKLSCCRSLCWIHSTAGSQNVYSTREDPRQQLQ